MRAMHHISFPKESIPTGLNTRYIVDEIVITTIRLALNTNILTVATVMSSPSIVRAFCQSVFTSVAIYIIQPNRATALAKRINTNFIATQETKLSTYHLSI
jgi:hypothetical protein